MEFWKPLVRFKKHRKETAWHSDFALDEGEVMSLHIAGVNYPLEICPKGTVLKVHLEVCVEPGAEHGEHPGELVVVGMEDAT